MRTLAFLGHGMGTPQVLETYVQAYHDVQVKVDMIRTAVQDNERLRLENANLRLRAESLQFDCTNREAANRTRELELQLDKETGARVGRTLASIHYTAPTHLLPPQLYTLGVSYFKGREDEKAAVILTYLTGLEENDSFKTPKNYLMTGVTWYRLDNFELADQYFAKVLQAPESPENLSYHAQARLWRGLASERMNKHTKAQFWLRDLIDHHPHSTEAEWVNSREAERAPSPED
jgi:hypothetical protein